MIYTEAYIEKCHVWKHIYMVVVICAQQCVRAEVTLYFSLFPVLPKFEVKVSAPQTITISDDEFQVSACAK